jgi:hypothetical protein
MTSLNLMALVRRRLASAALVLTVLQCTLLFWAPVSACCRGAQSTAPAVETTPKVCCPAGAHAPGGDCPFHKAGVAKSTCAMRCEAPQAPTFLLGALGILPSPALTVASPIASTLHVRPVFRPFDKPSLPDAPPPRLL